MGYFRRAGDVAVWKPYASSTTDRVLPLVLDLVTTLSDAFHAPEELAAKLTAGASLPGPLRLCHGVQVGAPRNRYACRFANPLLQLLVVMGTLCRLGADNLGGSCCDRFKLGRQGRLVRLT